MYRHQKFMKITLSSLLFCCLLICACGKSDEGVIEETIDDVSPLISCRENIEIEAAFGATGAIIEYRTPEGRDNRSGAITIQTAGLASGEVFPIGVTLNTFEVTDAAGNQASCSFSVTVLEGKEASLGPFFVDDDPAPSDKSWTTVEALSDEFDSEELDETKWLNTDPRRWIGRAPGLFKKASVSLRDGELKLTADILPEEEVVRGNTFTHAGAYIGSQEAAVPGYYFECRMKANKTFMSSTFWLINHKNEASGCDRRVTELDITECVGEVNTTADWARRFDETIHSNTHSRQAECSDTPTGSAGNNAPLGNKAWEEYHVYGAWWKSPKEVQFFLDGKKIYKVTPKADFDLPMYLRMVVETYDWNPTPADGGMTGTEEERTTSYDWVRTWKLD